MRGSIRSSQTNVFNLTVASEHGYFTSAARVLSHNASYAQANPDVLLRDIKHIPKPGGSNVNLTNVEDYVEAPLVDPVRFLFERNIQTTWASANKGDAKTTGLHFNDGKAYAVLGILWDSLSPENKKILEGVFPVSIDDPRIEHALSEYGTDGTLHGVSLSNLVNAVLGSDAHGAKAIVHSQVFPAGGERFHIYVPIHPDMSAAEVSNAYLSLLRDLQPQEKIEVRVNQFDPMDLHRLNEKWEGNRYQRSRRAVATFFNGMRRWISGE